MHHFHGLVLDAYRALVQEQDGLSFHRWWDDLGRPYLDAATITRLIQGIDEVTSQTSDADLAARRDALVTAVVAATHARTP